jgi:hypothetical protein
MPVAGPNSVSRANAHMRWAERYEKAKNGQKAVAHFGRALDYEAMHFGTLDTKRRKLANPPARDSDSGSGSDSDDPRQLIIFPYADPIGELYSETLFRAAAALPKIRGSVEINYAREKMNKSLADLARGCKLDPDKCEEKRAFDQLLAQRNAVADDAENSFVSDRRDKEPAGKKLERGEIVLQFYDQVLAEYGSPQSRAIRSANRTQR